MTPPTKAMLELADAFDIGFAWALSLRGQNIEDSRAVGRTLQSDLFADLAIDLDGFNSFKSGDDGIVEAKRRIKDALRSSQNNGDSGERERVIEALEIGREFAAYHTRPFPQNISGKLEKIDAAIRALKSGEKGS